MKWTNKPLTVEQMKQCRTLPQTMRVCLSAESVEPSLPDTLLESNAEVDKIVTNDADGVITRTYRALSAVDMDSRGIDYSNPVAVAAMQRDLNTFHRLQTGHRIGVFKDHARSVNDWIGWVEEANWSPGGKTLPPGVNQVISYDEKALGPAVAQGVRRNILHSVSVTIDFGWEKSHQDMDDDEFFEAWFMGKNGEDGKPVRVVPNKFHNNLETSLVWAGQDVFAKNLEAAAVAATTQSMSSTPEYSSHSDTTGLLWTGSYLPLYPPGTNVRWLFADGTESTQEDKTGMTPEIQAALLKLMSQLDPTIGEVNEISAEQIDLFTGKISAYAKELSAVNAELTETKKVADAYRNSLKDRLAKSAALVLDPTSAGTIIEMANRACTIQELETLTGIYERRADELFPLKCPKCKVELSRQSSVQQNLPTEENAKPQGVIERPDDQIRQNLK